MQRQNCRVCHSAAVEPILDLGITALANRFILPEKREEPEPRFPLCVGLCHDCGLVQLDLDVPREVLFKDYIYVSGTSDQIKRHGRWLAETFCRRYHLGLRDLVMEAASNDGSILRAFQARQVRVVGIEPAANVAAQAQVLGIPTLVEFFDERLAKDLRRQYGPVRLFLARHVLAHVTDLHGFVAGIKQVLAEDGVAVIEVHHLAALYRELAFDTIYHEHLCYFSLGVLQTLFGRFGLAVLDTELLPIHGGSLLVQVVHGRGPYQFSRRLETVLQAEQAMELRKIKTWQGFAKRVANLKEELLAFIDRLIQDSQSLAGYGAPAKANTLLSYCGIGPDRLPYLVDKSSFKQGLLTPGQHIPVYHPEVLLRQQPDVTLILAWNFAEEIIEQQAEYQRRGGRFAVPIPKPSYK